MQAGGRRKGKARSRILYWFRTPPGVRVGRAALDEDAIRLIEEYNPDVEFDWTRILRGQGAETAPAENRDRETKAGQSGRRRPDRRPPATSQAQRPSAGTDKRDEPVEEVTAPARAAAEAEEADVGEAIMVGEAAPVEFGGPRAPDARLGPEGLSRLRARHAEVLARITERIQDPGRREELKAQAERLNPDTWVTDDEVTAGLEAYEGVYESLRNVIGGQARRRRRKRRRGGSRQEQRPPAPSEASQTDEPGDDGSSPDDRNEDEDEDR